MNRRHGVRHRALARVIAQKIGPQADAAQLAQLEAAAFAGLETMSAIVDSVEDPESTLDELGLKLGAITASPESLRRFSIEKWSADAMQAAAMSCGACTEIAGLVGIDMVAQDGNTFAHGHFDLETARRFHADFAAAIEEAERGPRPASTDPASGDEPMPIPDEGEVRRLFEHLNFVTAGEPTVNALAAIQDLYCATICVVSEDRGEAMRLARELHDAVQMTVRKNFDWYSASGKRPVGPATRS